MKLNLLFLIPLFLFLIHCSLSDSDLFLSGQNALTGISSINDPTFVDSLNPVSSQNIQETNPQRRAANFQQGVPPLSAYHSADANSLNSVHNKADSDSETTSSDSHTSTAKSECNVVSSQIDMNNHPWPYRTLAAPPTPPSQARLASACNNRDSCTGSIAHLQSNCPFWKNHSWLTPDRAANEIVAIDSESVIWCSGEFHGRDWCGGAWLDGHFSGGSWLGGTWYGGYYSGGHWHNGTWLGGTTSGGHYWDGDTWEHMPSIGPAR